MGYDPQEAMQHILRCVKLSVMQSINYIRSACHCSSKAIENVAGALGGRLRASTLHPRVSERCSIRLRSGDRVGPCLH
ncbi:hypothetical protein TNCV_294421 [Trichonephila clavipes]|nr:hypothetical protein TNCV_294421 [Trichonephila clavipes]